ncbi:hypothetical protein QTP86_025926 [Hemibagrus guttatus]|nr:hypothetical protein QTP86_025926 [Hemibagrus guttatus]
MMISLRQRVVNFFYLTELTIKVYSESEERSKIGKVISDITGRLYKMVNIISPSNEEDSDVNVVFCPIVSRAGTDIAATLSRLQDDKPTIVCVLHHTFDHNYSAPCSRSYERNNLIMVDILFHEDSGLLKISKNDEAISRAGNYLKQYAKPHLKVNKKRLIMFCSVVCLGVYVPRIKYFQRLLLRCLPRFLTVSYIGPVSSGSGPRVVSDIVQRN